MHVRITSVLFVLIAVVSCSNDSVSGPGPRPPNTTVTLSLTSVNGVHIPAAYFTDVDAEYNSWADSGTVTLQADGVVAFRLYESATSPVSAPHADQPSQYFFYSGELTSDSTFEIDYTDSQPDFGTISRDGSVTVNLTGVDGLGKPQTFGKWAFTSLYHGVAFNPAPRIETVTPSNVPILAADTTVLLNGTGFMPTTTAFVNRTGIKSTYISAEQLKVVVPASLLGTPGVFDIEVVNPEPGGGTYYFPFAVNRPAPTITSLTPNTAVAGSFTSDITVTGTAFDANAIVTLNGVARKVNVTNSTTLHVPLTPADIASTGTIQVEVVNPPPGGGPSHSLPFTVTGDGFNVTSQMVPMAATVLAADPTRPVVYVGLANDAVHPNSVSALDGATGHVLWSIAAGGAPSVMTVSSDGQFLYYGLKSMATLHRITLASASPSLDIPLINDVCIFTPHGITVSQYYPRTIAVEQSCVQLFVTLGKLTVYDDAVPRPNLPQSNDFGTGMFVFGNSASTLYGFAGGAFVQLTVDDAAGVVSGPASSARGPEILYLGGKLYTTNGYVFDPVARTPSPNLPGYPTDAMSIAANRDEKTLYVLRSDRQSIAAFDLAHGTAIGEIGISGISPSARNLVRWGADGMAFILGNPGNVYLIQSNLVR